MWKSSAFSDTECQIKAQGTSGFNFLILLKKGNEVHTNSPKIFEKELGE